MRKSTVITTILSFLSIAFIIGFGIFAMVQTNRTVTSKFKIEITDQNVKVEVNAVFDQNGQTQNFNSENESQSHEWQMPNLVLPADGTAKFLDLEVLNHHQNLDVKFVVNIHGIKYDPYNRYKTFVQYSVGDTISYSNQYNITSTAPYKISVDGDVTKINIRIGYQMIKIDQSFSGIQQNISLVISEEIDND